MYVPEIVITSNIVHVESALPFPLLSAASRFPTFTSSSNRNDDDCTVASVFQRQNAAPARSQPTTTTTYPSGLKPIGPREMNGNRQLLKRASRTDLDFEQALRSDGTFILKEGLDVSSLGAEMSPQNASYNTSTITPSRQNATRHAQPSELLASQQALSPTPLHSSTSTRSFGNSSSSSNEVFYDAEDTERQTNRRSLYRSPGTASSPDLATLLKKAKERGTVLDPALLKGKEERREPPPPMPTLDSFERPSIGSRPRSSTTSNPSTPTKQKGKHARPELPTKPHDWYGSSSRSVKENGSNKPSKSSMRQKTSALFGNIGKMLGQGGTLPRERAKPDATTSAPTTPTQNLFSSLENAPPVPPLPSQHQQHATNPSGAQRVPQPSDKPLPPVLTPSTSDTDDRSMVFVEKSPSQSTGQPSPVLDTPNRSDATPTVRAIKGRSQSIGDDDNSKNNSPLSTPTPSHTAPAKTEDASLGGILDDFKGQLSQLETIQGSPLDLKDPASRRASARRSQTDGVLLTTKNLKENGERQRTLSSNGSSPILTLSIPTGSLEDSIKPTPIIPPRTTSLQKPRVGGARPTSVGPGNGPPLGTSPRVTSNPLGSRKGSPLIPQQQFRGGDASRLRSLHKSSASSSEPSLIAAFEEATTSPQRRGSHNDLQLGEASLRRFTSRTSGRQSPTFEDTVEMDNRAKELSKRCWDEDEDFLHKEKISEWLGGTSRINKLALQHYVQNFDFSGLRLDMAFRRLCGKLFLKGETQQVDRILEEFSKRYWECNNGSLYGSSNIVHAVAYSLLLLNTDLHVADLANRMSRSQFVKNTLSAIQMQLQPSSATGSSADLTYDDGSSTRSPTSDDNHVRVRAKRSDSMTSWNSVSREAVTGAPGSLTSHNNESSPSLQSSTPHGSRTNLNAVYGRGWESNMETLLKEMYNAVKSQQILQPLTASIGRSSTSLSPGGPLARNRSLRSNPNDRFKRGSVRGLQAVLLNSGLGSSNNSFVDGRVSPSPSFATSAHEAMSSSSFLTPTLGFAHNLSHTIIRETREDDDRSIQSDMTDSTTISISDEELALLGAPWAKEGMLNRKQYWESTGKRAKDKSWMEVFVVIQKGELNMFTFGDHLSGASGTFGGGNWLSNADSVGTLQLAHSLANALPPPGYNRQRPHCMVLTMPNGAVYFFQAGTEELVNEWVSTCNYWAARTSKEPLTGGVSNMEYGWNRVVDVPTHGRSQTDGESVRDTGDSMSVRSGRSTRSRFGWRDGSATVRAGHSPWADKTFINDWKPPLPPTVASTHDEETQMDALKKHVNSMKRDLERHNELREPMTALYQPRTANAMKAQTNWERKSQYLLTEIVKYDSYIESLQSAMTLRLKKRGEKALERALNTIPSEDDASMVMKGKWKGPEEAIQEEVEPSTPGPTETQMTGLHRREIAE